MKNKIKQYDVITLDTNIFCRNAYDFTKETLLQLQQFKHTPISFILSNIVVEEIKKHLKQNQKAKKAEFDKAFKNAQVYFDFSNQEIKNFESLITSQNEDIAYFKFDEYRQKCDIQVIYCHESNILKEVTEAYFQNKPPFEETGNKKAEFPDAIALFSLEKWAKEHNKKILAASDDKGWQDFAQSSDYIDVVPDLNALVEMLKNQLHSIGVKIVNPDNTLYLTIDSEFINFLIFEVSHFIDDTDQFDIEADSPYIYDYDDIYVKFINLHLQEDTIELLEKNDDSFVIGLECIVNVDVSVHFNMFVYDSIDKEDIFIGSLTKTITQSLEIYMEINCWENNGGLEKEVSKIEFCSNPIIEMGAIEPEYAYEPEFYGD